MASIDNFYILFYEKDLCYKLIDYWNEVKDEKPKLISQEDHDYLGTLVERIKNFDFKKYNELSAQFQVSKNKYKIKNELNVLINEYNELSDINYRTTGEEKVMVLIFSSFEENPHYKSPIIIYQYLSCSDIVRNKKFYPITDEIILKTFNDNPDFYRESLFIDSNPDLIEMIDTYAGFFQRYMDENKKIKHKHSVDDSLIKCDESKNGILRGIVHMIGYGGYGGKNSIDFMMDIINSNFLEVQFKDYNPTSGIFTTLLGNDNDIGKLYKNSRYHDNGIFFIISLSILDDLDYWGGKHGRGSRKKTDFYKGVCYKCADDLEKYSSAERLYMSMVNDKFKNFHELIFPADIKISKYVQEIYVENEFTYESIMESDKIPLSIKKIITNKENTTKVYNKGCKGKKPKRIDKKLFNKLVKKIEKRELMTDIPKVDVVSINTKRRVKLLYDPTKSANSYEFPIPS